MSKTFFVFVLSAMLSWAMDANARRYCGPYTIIPQTKNPVNNKHPPCEGEVYSMIHDIARIIKQNGEGGDAQGASKVADEVTKFIERYIPSITPATQTNGNCVAICVRIPSNENVISEDIYWNDTGGMPDLNGPAYTKNLYGHWGPGPGWHRIDPNPVTVVKEGHKMYCHVFNNWKHDRVRSAVQCVDTDGQ